MNKWIYFFGEVKQQVNICFPQKVINITSDDSPWCTEKVKVRKRLKEREYRKHRCSKKLFDINKNTKLPKTCKKKVL